MKLTVRTLVISLCCIVFVHYLMIANERYAIVNTYSTEFGPDRTEHSYLSYWQYKDYIKSLEREYRASAVDSATLTYFKVIPEWGMNIVYACYFVWVLLLVKFNVPSNLMLKEKPPVKRKVAVDPRFDFEDEA